MKFLPQQFSLFFKILSYSCIVCSFINIEKVSAQINGKALYKVLMLTGEKQGAKGLPQDHGSTGIYQKLLKLTTTASVLHTQAHPDDEAADLLTYLSRGLGARIALLSLNRGESGGNIVGQESFDQLGLLRTEEFLLASSYYGLDDLYFTKLIDYGFSKRVDEAYDKWGKENVLREMVRVIRINRPLVIISRFHGTERDGHGNHQAAGEISQQAFQLAGDSTAFPEQITKEGLRPWKALKFYRGGVTEKEHWNINLNTGLYCPWLGQSYKNFSMLGYSFHRSQFGGQFNEVYGPSIQYYERLQNNLKDDEKENSFFTEIDTAITGIFTITRETIPSGVMALLAGVAENVSQAINNFQVSNPTAIIKFLTDGLSKTRSAIQLLTNQPDAVFMLQVKERQFCDAINATLSIQLKAMAVPGNTNAIRSFYEPLPTFGFAVADRPFKIETELVNNSTVSMELKSFRLIAPTNWMIGASKQNLRPLQSGEKIAEIYNVTIPENADYSQPYFYRNSLEENQYLLKDQQFENLPWGTPAAKISAVYTVNNVEVELQTPVQSRQANLPYGYDQYTLKVAPAIAVNMKPGLGIIPVNKKIKSFDAQIELVNNYDSSIKGTLTVKVPDGWKAEPLETPFSFNRAGEKNNFNIKISMPAIAQKVYTIQAVATANNKAYTQGYDLITHRDLDQAILYHPAVAIIKGINVNVAPGIIIGYVMGVGDEVPRGLEQLGAKVQLLNTSDLATGALNKYDVIIIGTRAYAVRQDLNIYNQRLLEYAKTGGHLILLFQTPEFVPAPMAPFPASLPGNSEEVSEEDSPVKLLAPNHRVLNYPNKITSADFDHWVEQRGSKFFSTWDTAYVPIISTYDKGQAPQSGGWLMAKYGKGYYTYCAYAFHRQLPEGVEGAYRIMANLISYGRK
jgi:LmbE family N-acetylglucosaminyl deacetylase